MWVIDGSIIELDAHVFAPEFYLVGRKLRAVVGDDAVRDPEPAYEALLHGLRMAISMGIQCLEVRGDSNLAISQINGDFDAKDPKMAAKSPFTWDIARFESPRTSRH